MMTAVEMAGISASPGSTGCPDAERDRGPGKTARQELAEIRDRRHDRQHEQGPNPIPAAAAGRAR